MRRALAAALALCVSACASRGAQPEEPAATPAALEAVAPLEELPPQTLTRGQCALVLWSRTTPARRIFMGLNAPPSARVQRGGRTLTLARTAASGEAAYGHPPVQTYSGEGLTLTASVEFDEGEGLVGGAVVPSAAVTLRDETGVETVIPAGGLLACQP